jgi:hypothetical protein
MENPTPQTYPSSLSPKVVAGEFILARGALDDESPYSVCGSLMGSLIVISFLSDLFPDAEIISFEDEQCSLHFQALAYPPAIDATFIPESDALDLTSG